MLPRTLVRHPGICSAVLVVLALGVGASTTIFTLVNAVLLRPLPYEEPERIFHLRTRGEGGGSDNVSYLDFLDFRSESGSFKSLAAAGPVRLVLTGTSRGAESAVGEYVSPGYFELFGVSALRGRTFEAEAPERTILVSEGLWRRRFGTDPNIVGSTIATTVGPFVVAGVMPGRFGGLTDEVCLLCSDVDFWIPAAASELVYDGFLEDRGRRWHYVVGRVATGVADASARAEVQSIAERLERGYPDTNRGVRASLVPLAENWRGGLRPGLLLLLLGSLLLLFIGNANVAHLMLALGARRFRETAVRASLGAGRGRLITEALSESLFLSLLGGALGVLSAIWLSRAIAAWSGAGVPGFVDYRIDVRVIAFALFISTSSAIAVGLVPALRASRINLTDALQGAARGASASTGRFGRVLLASQMALVVLLLVHALLLVRSYQNLEGAAPGFAREDLLVFEINPNAPQYQGVDAQRAFLQRLEVELASLPGGERITIAAPNLPPRTFVELDVFPEGRELDAAGGSITVETHRVASNFFQLLRVPLLEGRGFGPADTENAPVSAVVSASLAERFWPGEDPVGKRLREREARFAPQGMTVVGVVGDIKYGGIRSDRPRELDLYLSLTQVPAGYFTVAARAEGDADAMRSAIRGVVQALDPEIPILATSTVEERFALERSDTALQSAVLAAFAGMAFIIAAIGIFGVASSSVAERTREIGIRIAMGGAPGVVTRTMVGKNLKPVLAGLAGGFLASMAVTRLVSSFLYGVRPWDTVSFASALLVLFAVSLMASYVPATRIATVDPVEALRRD